MPSKSPEQAKLLRAVAHGWKPTRMRGPPVKVAKEFVKADEKAKGYQFGGLAKVLEQLRGAKAESDPEITEERALELQAQAENWFSGPVSDDPKGWQGPEAYLENYPKGMLAGVVRQMSEKLDPYRLGTYGQPGGPGGGDAGDGRSLREILTPEFAEEYASAITPAAEGGYMEQEYQFGGRTGLGAFAGRRAGGFPGGSRGIPPQLMQQLQQRRGVRRGSRGFPGRGRGFPGGGGGVPPQIRQRMMRGRGLPQQGGLGKTVGLGGRGRVQPGGPGGQMPDRQFIGPGASATPGIPPNLRGYIQKMKSLQRPGGQARIGMGDQQGAMARARQSQTGRPPISRRSGFPGRAR